jgi:hypothetical protein
MIGGITCPSCNGDIRVLILPDRDFPDYVCRCSCGRVTVRRDNEVIRAFDFKRDKEITSTEMTR